jgi:hypothetical protein
MAAVAQAAVAEEELDAAHHFIQAAELFTRIDQPFQAARCYLQGGLLELHGHQTVAGREHLEQALVLFSQLGARRGQERALAGLSRAQGVTQLEK